jgi:hypothetical protein
MAKDSSATIDPRTPPGPAPMSDVDGGSAVEFAEWDDGVLVRWYVNEVDARRVPGARGARCLVFVCESVIRRVWRYPSDWRSLDGHGLARLSWSR